MASSPIEESRAKAGYPRFEIRLPVAAVGSPAFVVRLSADADGKIQTEFVAEFRNKSRDQVQDATACAVALAAMEGAGFLDVTPAGAMRESSCLIAMDYDGTYSRDPALWNGFIASARARGHEVVCITGREPRDGVNFPGAIYYAGSAYKRRCAEGCGLNIDVWIDDEPGQIEPGRKLEWE